MHPQKITVMKVAAHAINSIHQISVEWHVDDTVAGKTLVCDTVVAM